MELRSNDNTTRVLIAVLFVLGMVFASDVYAAQPSLQELLTKAHTRYAISGIQDLSGTRYAVDEGKVAHHLSDVHGPEVWLRLLPDGDVPPHELGFVDLAVDPLEIRLVVVPAELLEDIAP